MKLSARLLLVAFIGCAIEGCAALRPPPELEGGEEIAVARGGSWSTYTVRPPHVGGPNGRVEIRRGRVKGMLGPRSVDLQATASELLGHAGKAVDIEVWSTGDKLEATGIWNGEQVHLEITNESLRGSLVGSQGHCQYVLDKTSADGTRSGVSICNGMPQETRLVFPARVAAWFSHSEAVALLLLLLDSAPLTRLG